MTRDHVGVSLRVSFFSLFFPSPQLGSKRTSFFLAIWGRPRDFTSLFLSFPFFSPQLFTTCEKRKQMCVAPFSLSLRLCSPQRDRHVHAPFG